MRVVAVACCLLACLIAVATAKNLNRRASIGARGLTVPSWEKLTANYPQGESPDVLKKIFNGDSAWITNTCATRMSYCLNKCGIKIPMIKMAGYGSTPDEETEQTIASKDNLRIIFRVRVLNNWIAKNFPKPTIVHSKKSDESDTAATDAAIAAFANKKGIIQFDVKWADATGHFDLWDGNNMWEDHHRNEDTKKRYFGLAYKITLWEAGSSGGSTVTSGNSGSSQGSGTRGIAQASKGPCSSNGKDGHCVTVDQCKQEYGDGKYSFIARTDGCLKFPKGVQCCVKA